MTAWRIPTTLSASKPSPPTANRSGSRLQRTMDKSHPARAALGEPALEEGAGAVTPRGLLQKARGTDSSRS